MAKHTPGPWKFEEDTVWSRNFGSIYAKNRMVAFVRDTKDSNRDRANGRLMAAAPEMKEAGLLYFAELDARPSVDSVTDTEHVEWARRVQAARERFQAACAVADGASMTESNSRVS